MDEKFLGFPANTADNNVGGFAAMPFGFDDGEGRTKLYVDRYEVFVNGDKVGEKIQRTQVEDPEYLQSYLTQNGFESFDYQVVGDHIEIHSHQDSHQIKQILSTYLSIR
ncbi:MAG TPA: hypothetical protein GX707_14655 [Epulopiscium sp.]|nr:hypothetical protein [Candidatus Epulonipiscium sp.]